MAPPLLLDVHVHYQACALLQGEGFDVVHAADVGLRAADDIEVLLAAREEGRVVVTRNYQHFASLVRALAQRGERFPGVLFLSPTISQADLQGHVAAIRRWCEVADDWNPVENTYGWIGSAEP